MAIKNNRIFGLSVSLSMADILDRKTALTNLGLNIDDLEIIRGSAAANFDKKDLQTLSNLTVPVWQSFDRYINDIDTYSGILEFSGGSDFQLRGNLKVAGQISATAFRYPILDTEVSGNPVLKWGDISTSRVSSWSTIGRTISYGADVSIGGELRTGKLKTRTVATPKIFTNSEVPTHKIKLRLNSVTRYVYAMKGIPLKFRGFFRSFTGTIGIVSSGIKGSWRINRVDGNGAESFEDQGTNTKSKLEYSSPFATERDIEFYYNPDQITSIELNNVNIRSLPKTSLSQLKTFIFSNNGLVDFPNISTFAPDLQTLNLSNNPFINGSNANLRKLNLAVRALLPSSLRSLDLRGCFNGGLQQGTLSTFADLREVYLSSSAGKYFYPDSTNPTGELPLFSNSDELQIFVCRDNDFRTIVAGDPNANPPTKSIKELSNLKRINLKANQNLLDDNFTLALSINSIEEINISQTRLRCPSLPNSSTLSFFRAYNNFNFGSLYTNWSGVPGEANTPTSDASFVFQGCNVLGTLDISSSSVRGFIPKFNNLALSSIDFQNCNGFIAGRPNKTGADIKCLYNDTFTNAPNISSFRLSVNNSSFTGEIESDTFAPIQDSISTLYLYASGRFTGSFPNLESCSALSDLRSDNQGWASTLPALSAANNISRIQLQSNNFTGPIRYSNRNNLNYLNVSNNQLTKIDSSFSAANLEYLYASSNNFSGTLPNLGTACPKVEYVSLNNNSYINYPKNNGGLSQLTSIKSLDLAVNAFNQSSIDNILFDLVDNYNASPRRGVIVNLSGGNSSPSNYPQISGIISGFDSINAGVVAPGGTGQPNAGDINLTTSDYIGDMSNLVPVSGTYSNMDLENVNLANQGAGANVSVTMTPVVYENIVTGINIPTLPTGTNFTGGVFTDQNPPAGGTAASVIVTVDGNGTITSIALDNPLIVTTRGTGYSQGDTIDIINNSQTINIPVSSIKKYYFTSITCTVDSINNGGSNYSDNQELQTPNLIRFIDTTTDQIVTRRLKLTVDGITQRQNTNVVVGITAVDFLRSKGWTIKVS